MPTVRLQQAQFDPGAEQSGFLRGQSAAGAAVTFTGIVRSDADDPLVSLTIEHFEALADSEIGRIVEDACQRFRLIDVLVIHRYGRMEAGEAIMQVTTLASHRQEAFAAAEFLMDYLKTGAPFWKKEERASGDRWVEATNKDRSAVERWTSEPTVRAAQ